MSKSLALGRQCEVVPLLGNHEVLLQSALEANSPNPFWLDQCAGQETLITYGGDLAKVPAEHRAVTRALAAMLSGKQPTNNSASGIAWVNGLCSTNYGYSFSQVFKIDYLSRDAQDRRAGDCTRQSRPADKRMPR